MKKTIILTAMLFSLALLNSGCGTTTDANDSHPKLLFCKPNQSELIKKIPEKGKIKYFFRGKTFCRISRTDKDGNEKYEAFLQHFHFEHMLFLTVSNMGSTKDFYAFCPVENLFVFTFKPEERLGIELLVIVHAIQKVFLVFERPGPSDFFVPTSQENAEKAWEKHFDILNPKVK